MPRITEVTPHIEYREIAQKLKQCPASFYYNLSAEALETCRKIANYTILGEPYPSKPSSPAEDGVVSRKIELLDELTDPYINRSGIKGLKNWGIRRFHELLRFCKSFFLKLRKQPDLFQAMHETFRKPLRREYDSKNSNESNLSILPAEIIAKIAGQALDFDSFTVLQPFFGAYEHVFWKGLAERLEIPIIHLDGNNYKKVVMKECQSLLSLEQYTRGDSPHDIAMMFMFFGVSVKNSSPFPFLKNLENRIKSISEAKAFKIENVTQLQMEHLAVNIITSWALSTSEDELRAIGRLTSSTSEEIRIDFLKAMQEKQLANNIRLFNFTNLGSSFLRKIVASNTFQHLILSQNNLTQFPDFLSPKIKSLNLSRNFLKEFPESIQALENLTYLNMSSNELKQVPDFVTKLPSLTVLDLSFNELKNLPEELGNLNNLTELSVNKNPIEALPESLGNLTNLEQLELNDHRLTHLPPSFSKLKELKFLHAKGEKRLEMPEYISTFTRLENLSWFGKVCQSFGENMRALKTLELTSGELVSADFISQSPNLERLSLNNNRLSSLPDMSSFSFRLKRISLNDNQFKHLPNLPPWAYVEAKGNEFSFFEQLRIERKHPGALL